MDNTSENGGDGVEKSWEDYEILIVSMNTRYWLWKGEEYLHAMLGGEDDVPWPVGCVVIDDPRKLHKVVPEEVDLGDLWMINALSILKMRNAKRIIDIHPDI